MAPEGGIAAVVSYLHIIVEAPGCAGRWFCTAESTLLLRTQMDPPGQQVTNFPPFPSLCFMPFFSPYSDNFLTVWEGATEQRQKGIAV